MIRRLLPYLLALLVLAALAVGVLGLDGTDDGDGDAKSAASRSVQGDDAGEDGGLVLPAACKGPEDRCVWAVQLLAASGSGSNDFEDVSCPGPNLCVAVGNDRYANFYPRKGLMGVWTGGRWKTTEAFEGGTKAVACPTTRWCMAIGNNPPQSWSLKTDKAPAAAAEWQVEAGSPPRPPGSAGELTLSDVSCTSENACTVAGIYWEQGYENYVAHWDGSRWALQPAPKPDAETFGATHGMLGVSCASESFCATVGAFGYKPFIQHWDGSAWRIALALDPDNPEGSLEGISCTSPSACMAVGGLTEKSGSTRPLALRWDGASWSVVETPPLRDGASAALRGVSCLSASSCVAVGSVSYSFSGEEAEETVAMAWDGIRWTRQPSPSPQAFSSFAGVSCAPSGACTAVGQAKPGSGGAKALTLVERFGQ